MQGKINDAIRDDQRHVISPDLYERYAARAQSSNRFFFVTWDVPRDILCQSLFSRRAPQSAVNQVAAKY